MRRRTLVVAAVGGLLSIASYAGVAAAQGHGATVMRTPTLEKVEVNKHGQGESLVLVVGGVYATRGEAEAAVARSNQGELQGYYLASTNDFRVTAAYADVRPAREEVPCTASGAANAVRDLPELSSMTPAQIEAKCQELQTAGQAATLTLVRDTRLVRVAVERDAQGADRLTSPAACASGSRCLGEAPATLANTGNLPADNWMAVSAFRTRVGAEQFVTWMRVAQSSPPAMLLQVLRQDGTTNIGLGQEAHPDGSGPVVGPLPQQEALQR